MFAPVLVVLGTLLRSAEARLGTGTVLLDQTTFDDFVQKNDRAVIDFFNPKDARWYDDNNQLEAALRQVRDFGSKVPFGKVDVGKDPELAKKYVPEGKYPQLVWFLHGHETQYHRSLRTTKDVSDFVMALDREPIVRVKSKEEAYDYMPSVFADLGESSPLYKVFQVVGAKHMDTVAFTLLDKKSNHVFDSGSIAWLANGNASEPVRYSGEATVDALEKWVRARLVKSEIAPEDPELQVDEGSRVVVGKTFEKEVLRADKDVVMLVYAPWCGFCKKFSPTWQKFAKEVEQEQHLVVAKMDGSRNSSPLPESFSWDSFPKVFFVKAGSQEPIHFDGNRTVDDLVAFVQKHSSKPLKLGGSADSPESAFDL